MILSSNIRRQGFKIRAVENNGILVDPINKLTPEQQHWIKANKPALRAELLAERWQWFLSLSTDYGIDRCVAGAEFPTEQDRLDVVEPVDHDDAILRRCMMTLCNCPRVKQRQTDYEAGRWVPVDQNGEVAARETSQNLHRVMTFVH